MSRLTRIGAAMAAISSVLVLAAAVQNAPGDRSGGAGTPAPRGASSPATGAPAQSADAPATMDTFDEGMERAGRGFKALRRSALSAATRTADLAAIQSLQSGLLMAKGAASALPMSPNAEKKFADDKAAYETALRRDLAQTLRQAIVVEAAMLDGSSESAKAAVAKLGEMQEHGHTLFQNNE